MRLPFECDVWHNRFPAGFLDREFSTKKYDDDVGGFCYRFWTKSWPELKRKKKSKLPILSESGRDKATQVVEAIERFVNIAGISLGLLQYLALTRAAEIWGSYHGWLRTRSSETPSESVVQSVIQTEYFFYGDKVPFCNTLRIISRKRRKHLL